MARLWKSGMKEGVSWILSKGTVPRLSCCSMRLSLPCGIVEATHMAYDIFSLTERKDIDDALSISYCSDYRRFTGSGSGTGPSTCSTGLESHYRCSWSGCP